MKGNLLSGLSRKNPKGDSGRRAQNEAGSMNSDATRDSVAKSHSLGGRTA
jgi:hypothetical protein